MPDMSVKHLLGLKQMNIDVVLCLGNGHHHPLVENQSEHMSMPSGIDKTLKGVKSEAPDPPDPKPDFSRLLNKCRGKILCHLVRWLASWQKVTLQRLSGLG